MILIAVNFMNVNVLSVLDNPCDLLMIPKDLDLGKGLQRHLSWKTINIATRKCYLFCHRNKEWTDPDMMGFYKVFLFPCFFLFRYVVNTLLTNVNCTLTATRGVHKL